MCAYADGLLFFCCGYLQGWGCLVNLWAVCIHSEVIAAHDVSAVFWKAKDGDKVSSDSESGGWWLSEKH